MLERSRQMNDGHEEKELWPGRFIVEIYAPKWPSNGWIYRDQRIVCHQQCMPGNELKDLMETFGITPDGLDVDGFIREVEHLAMTFNEEQANQVVEYLRNRWGNDEGITAWKRPLTPSILEDILNLASSLSQYDELFRLSWDPDYALGVEVLARYELNDSRIVGIAE